MAGMAAESICNPDRQGLALGTDDFRQALALVKPSVDTDDPDSGGRAIQFIMGKFHELRAELLKHWPAVAALADALMSFNELAYDAAIMAIESAPPEE